MASNHFIGKRVIAWARPADDLLLVFGAGEYRGTETINMDQHPVVRFDDQELDQVLFPPVQLSAEDTAKQVMDGFAGDIHEESLENFMSEDYQPPARSQVEPPEHVSPTARRHREPTPFEEIADIMSEIETAKEKERMHLEAAERARVTQRELRTKMRDKRALLQKLLNDMDNDETETEEERT